MDWERGKADELYDWFHKRLPYLAYSTQLTKSSSQSLETWGRGMH